jgi:hypothetical protein
MSFDETLLRKLRQTISSHPQSVRAFLNTDHMRRTIGSAQDAWPVGGPENPAGRFPERKPDIEVGQSNEHRVEGGAERIMVLLPTGRGNHT